MFGTDEATAAIRCTNDIMAVYQDDVIEIYDVFGDNDEETYHNKKFFSVAKTWHKIVVVYTDSVDNVLNLARLCTALRVPLIFFRNKAEDLSTEELEVVRDNDTKMLRKVTGQVVTLIVGSAKLGVNTDVLKAALVPPSR